MVYVLRTGIIWNALPREKFGGLSSSALHDKFQQWSIAGVFTKIWQRGLAEYDELQGISWAWQAADSASIEAPLARGSADRDPTDRGKERLKTTCSCRREWHSYLTTRQCSQPA
jgi:transposase